MTGEGLRLVFGETDPLRVGVGETDREERRTSKLGKRGSAVPVKDMFREWPFRSAEANMGDGSFLAGAIGLTFEACRGFCRRGNDE